MTPHTPEAGERRSAQILYFPGTRAEADDVDRLRAENLLFRLCLGYVVDVLKLRVEARISSDLALERITDAAGIAERTLESRANEAVKP